MIPKPTPLNSEPDPTAKVHPRFHPYFHPHPSSLKPFLIPHVLVWVGLWLRGGVGTPWMESPVSCLCPTGPASSPTVLSPSALWPVFRCLLSLRHPPSVPVQERARACDDLCSSPALPVCSPFHTVTLSLFSHCHPLALFLSLCISHPPHHSFSLRVFFFSRSFSVAHPPHLSLCFPTSVSLSSHVFFMIKFRLPSVLLLLFPSQHLVISPPPCAFLFSLHYPLLTVLIAVAGLLRVSFRLSPSSLFFSSSSSHPTLSLTTFHTGFWVSLLLCLPHPHLFPPYPASLLPSLNPCLTLSPCHPLILSLPLFLSQWLLPSFPQTSQESLFPPLLARRTSCSPRSFSLYFSLKAPALSLSPCAPCLSSPQGLHPLMSPQKEPAPSALSCLFHRLSTRVHTGPWAREVGQRMKGQEERQSSLSLVTSPCAAPPDWRVGPDPRQ